MLAETHGTDGTQQAYTPPAGTRAYWSAGTAARAGVGLLIRESFLERFQLHPPSWEVLDEGRLACLHLQGQEGSLDLFACYFPTGFTRDLRVSHAAGRKEDQAPLRQHRERLTRIIAGRTAPGTKLSIVAGDFNFVLRPQDRWCTATGAYSGNLDKAEAAHWHRVMDGAGLYELHQEEYTHSGPQSQSRLDRVYVNQPVSDQLDKRVFATALEWPGKLSAHRPVAFGRVTKQCKPQEQRAIAEAVIQQETWPSRVAAEFHDELHRKTAQQTEPFSALHTLALLKQSIRTVSNRMQAEGQAGWRHQPPSSDPLGVVMSLLRCIERRRTACLEVSWARHPPLRHMITTTMLQQDPAACCEVLRRYAMELARAAVQADLTKLQLELAGLSKDKADKRRTQLMLRLRQLAPGQTTTIKAMENSQGVIVTSGADIAEALASHWKDTFTARRVNPEQLRQWLAEDAREDGRMIAAARGIARNSVNWEVTRKDIARAIRSAPRSSPGPDGIPYSAWRRLGHLAEHVLRDSIQVLSGPGGLSALWAAFPADAQGNTPFNSATMAFIPKKVAHESEDGQRFFKPHEVRPLSIMNTDNRLMANAVRMRTEPMLDKIVSDSQRGFLPGRSLIQNVVQIDTAMRTAALEQEAAGALFFDFAAAFPSLAHDYLHAVLKHLGLPASFSRFVEALYTGNGCDIAAGGETHKGFCISSGIRQGCPLSPLLFAIVLDPFLRLLKRRVPDGTQAAYADDLAMIVLKLLESMQVIAPAFTAFAAVSGLMLNLSKTVVIPLGDVAPAEVRAQFAAAHPGWGAVSFQHWASYLGFVLGPDAGTRSWKAALAKYEERAALWKHVALGLFFTVAAYNVYVASLLGFLLQLEPLPPEWPLLEERTLRSLVPGPYRWASAEDLRRLKRDFCLPQEFVNLQEVSTAARFRVYHREARTAGGLHVRENRSKLDRDIAASTFMERGGRWRSWFHSSFLHNLAAAEEQCKDKGITIQAVEAEATSHSQRPWSEAQQHRATTQVQKTARTLLIKEGNSQLRTRLRHKMARWELPIHGARQVERALLILPRLAKLLPPRVQAALLRTWYNGWCTHRRFQREGGGACMFGCLYGQDSIEHYSTCRHVFHYGKFKLRLPDPQGRLERRMQFFLLDPVTTRVDADLQMQALLNAAVYALHCKHRQLPMKWSEPEQISRALAQAVKEAAMGHEKAMRAYDGRWLSV